MLPFTIWTLRGFVGGRAHASWRRPRWSTAAGRLRAFFTVTFPLVAPGLVATGVFAFIQAWNEFIFALVIMNRPEHQTLPVWLQAFNEGAKGTDWGGVMAGSTLMAIPVIIFFLDRAAARDRRPDGRRGQGLSVDLDADLRASADAVSWPPSAGPALPDCGSRRDSSGGLGGVCLFGSNIVGPHDPDQLVALTGALHDGRSRAASSPLDEEGGDVTRLELPPAARIPGNAALGAVDDVEADATRWPASIGAELAAAGVDLDLAPSRRRQQRPAPTR